MTVELQNLPFSDALAFFRSKGVVSPEKFRELDALQKARAFSVSGVTRMDVLNDLHAAIEKQIASGVSYGDFKKEVGNLMANKGWDGLAPYRLDTIFRTNIQSAYQAGHYQQMMEVADRRPFWQYVAVMDSRTRPSHAAMNGKVFRYDDPFWRKNFPQNGFNCRCTVRSLSERELKRDGLSVRKGGPDIADPGWDFNIGEAAVNIDIIAGEKAMAAAAPIRKMFLDEMASSGNYKETFASFVDSVLTGKKATGILQTAGWMDAAVLDYLAGELSITPATPVIAANDRGLLHLYRESKIARGAALSIDEIRRIPEVISGYEAVLWDSQDPALLYVFSSGSMKGKIVVAVDYKLKGQGIVNLIKTAGKTQNSDLRDRRYVVIKGRI